MTKIRRQHEASGLVSDCPLAGVLVSRYLVLWVIAFPRGEGPRGQRCRKTDADLQVLDKQTATDLGKEFGVVSPDRVLRIIHAPMMP